MPNLTYAEQEEIIRWSRDKSEGITVTTHRESTAKKLIAAGARVRHSWPDPKPKCWTLILLWEDGWLPRYPKKKRIPSEKQLEHIQEMGKLSKKPSQGGKK